MSTILLTIVLLFFLGVVTAILGSVILTVLYAKMR